MGGQPRKQTLVAPKLQWRFALQVLALQAVAVLALSAASQLGVWNALRATSDPATTELLRSMFNDGLITLLWVSPIVGLLSVLVALRLSLQVFGPIPRLRASLAALASNQPASPLHFRPDDALVGLDEDINRVAAALEAARKHESEPQRV